MAGPAAEQRALNIPADDAVVVFRTQSSGVRGRLVRLGNTVDGILSRHGMPAAASEALGEALVLAGLLGSALPGDGKIILQTRSDGVVSFLVADCEASGRLRGYARYDAETLAVLAEGGEKLDPGSVLGDGHLAITIDPGPSGDRYQGIVALEGAPLATAAAAYFDQREGLPTFTTLAVARHYASSRQGDAGAVQGSPWRWRAGGLMMQSMVRGADDGNSERLEDWTRIRMLSATIEDHELLDPTLSPERLLLRLFHEEGVIVERVQPLSNVCGCSREKVFDVLTSFGAKDLEDMRDETGDVVVTCEFCAARYVFPLSEIGDVPG